MPEDDNTIQPRKFRLNPSQEIAIQWIDDLISDLRNADFVQPDHPITRSDVASVAENLREHIIRAWIDRGYIEWVDAE